MSPHCYSCPPQPTAWTPGFCALGGQVRSYCRPTLAPWASRRWDRTAPTSESAQGLHQPRNPAHRPHLHGNHLWRLQLHILHPGGAAQASPPRQPHPAPRPSSLGRGRGSYLRRVSLMSCGRDTCGVSACPLTLGLPASQPPAPAKPCSAHFARHTWSEPTCGLPPGVAQTQGPWTDRGHSQPCSPGLTPSACLEDAGPWLLAPSARVPSTPRWWDRWVGSWPPRGGGCLPAQWGTRPMWAQCFPPPRTRRYLAVCPARGLTCSHAPARPALLQAPDSHPPSR